MTTFTLASGREISGATGGKALEGDGPIALLVHGAAMDRSVWALQTRWLAHHGYSALAIDLPGHGGSAEAPLASIDAYASWLADVVTELARPVHLVGHSMGSFVALEAANRAELASLMLVGTAASMPTHPALLEAAENNDPLASALMAGWAFAPAVRNGPHPSPGSSMAGGTQALIGQAADGVLHSDLRMCAEYDQATASAEAIRTPTTLLLGALDRMTPVAKAQPLIDALTDPTVHVLPGVGHMLMIEAPRETRQAVADAAAGS